MTDDLEHPFVPRNIPVDTRRRPVPDELAECRRAAKAGADQLRARAATAETAPKLTDAESAAIARRRIDQEGTR